MEVFSQTDVTGHCRKIRTLKNIYIMIKSLVHDKKHISLKINKIKNLKLG